MNFAKNLPKSNLKKILKAQLNCSEFNLKGKKKSNLNVFKLKEGLSLFDHRKCDKHRKMVVWHVLLEKGSVGFNSSITIFLSSIRAKKM